MLSQSLRGYVIGYLYSALVNSYCSEQNNRVQAMEAATHSADQLLDELGRRLRRERQAAVTREINEVSAGALAQRQERERREQA